MAITCCRANHHDQKFALKTVDKITVGGRIRRPKRLGADKGYDSDELRRGLKSRTIKPILIRRDNNLKNISLLRKKHIS